jgi:hypothetical protein
MRYQMVGKRENDDLGRVDYVEPRVRSLDLQP